jgi:hypothetical protein
VVNVDDITPERVREVLRHLARDRTPGRTPLAGLEVVRRALEDAGFQPTPTARQYEVGRLVVEIVEQELAALRRRAALTPDPEDPLTALVLDFSLGLRELESWSAVYHMYLRPDLDLSLKGLTDVLDDRHRRTVQRRLRRGAAGLAGRLQAAERSARLAGQDEALAARLPAMGSGALVGVSGLVRRIGDRLASRACPGVLALRGPGGIGKTALAEALARHALRQQAFDSVAWVDVDRPAGPPPTRDQLLGAIAEQLGASAGPVGLAAAVRAKLRRRPALLVVDGVDAPERLPAAMEVLGSVGGPSRALVTGRLGWSAWPDVEVMEVPALAEEAAGTLLRSEAARRGLDDVALAPDDVLAPLLDAASGHPLALRLAAAELRAEEPARLAEALAAGDGAMAALCRQVWGEAWRRAGEPARAVVRAACADGERSADRSTLAERTGFPPPLLTGALAEAVDLGLLELVAGSLDRRYRTGLFLRRYLRQVA